MLHLPSIKLFFDTVMFVNWVVYVVYSLFGKVYWVYWGVYSYISRKIERIARDGFLCELDGKYLLVKTN